MVRSTMRGSFRNSSPALFTVEEIAQAAGVTSDQAWQAVRLGQAIPYGHYVTAPDAVRLIRVLRGLEPASERHRAPLVVTPDRQRRAGRGLMASGALHIAGVAALILITSLGLLPAQD